MLRKGARETTGTLAREIGRDALRFLLAAAACFGAGAIVGTAVGDGLAAALTAAATGTALDLMLLPLLAPTQVTMVLGSLRPMIRARRPGPRAAT